MPVDADDSAGHPQLSALEAEVLWEYAKLADKVKRVSSCWQGGRVQGEQESGDVEQESGDVEHERRLKCPQDRERKVERGLLRVYSPL